MADLEKVCRFRERCGSSFSAKWRCIRKTCGHFRKTVRGGEQFMVDLEGCGGLENVVVVLEIMWSISGKV